jgi:Na+/proline symporter
MGGSMLTSNLEFIQQCIIIILIIIIIIIVVNSWVVAQKSNMVVTK